MGIAEASALRGDHQIAAQHGFQTTGQGHAIDGGNHRFRKATQRVKKGDDGVQQVFLARLRRAAGLEVGAGTEGRTGSGKDHHADLIVIFPAVQACGHGLQHFTVKGVHGFRTGQGDPAHLTLEFKRNGLAHLQSSIKIQLTFLSGLEITRLPQTRSPPLADGARATSSVAGCASHPGNMPTAEIQ
ncbi:hypothetical protein D3C80_1342280 [compost metagenome]